MVDEPPATDPPAERVPWGYRLEAWLAGATIRIVGLLPIDWASALGGALARTAGPRLGITKRARLNLSTAMPDLGTVETDTLIRGMWDNLGRVVAEYPHLRKICVFEPGGRSRRTASNMWIGRSRPGGG